MTAMPRRFWKRRDRSAPVPVLVQNHPAPDTSWMRFVAVLCFIEFYVYFVHIGHELWTSDPPGPRTVNNPRIYWLGGILLVRACAFYVLGRSLWLNRGRLALRFVLAGLAALAAALARGHWEAGRAGRMR